MLHRVYVIKASKLVRITLIYMQTSNQKHIGYGLLASYR